MAWKYIPLKLQWAIKLCSKSILLSKIHSIQMLFLIFLIKTLLIVKHFMMWVNSSGLKVTTKTLMNYWNDSSISTKKVLATILIKLLIQYFQRQNLKSIPIQKHCLCLYLNLLIFLLKKDAIERRWSKFIIYLFTLFYSRFSKVLLKLAPTVDPTGALMLFDYNCLSAS